MSRSNITKDAGFSPSERSISCGGGAGGGGGDDNEATAATAEPTPNAPSPEGYSDPQPLLYGGGEEAAAIASRYVYGIKRTKTCISRVLLVRLFVCLFFHPSANLGSKYTEIKLPTLAHTCLFHEKTRASRVRGYITP